MSNACKCGELRWAYPSPALHDSFWSACCPPSCFWPETLVHYLKPLVCGNVFDLWSQLTL